MKKLFLLFALVAMYSCGPAIINNKSEQGILEEFDRITHFTYKGHKYISFEHNPHISHATLGVVHDPNCPCHENSN